MKDRLKIGNRISCVIEDTAPNYILVTFTSTGNSYRGVLINEICSTVRRTIPENYFPPKTILDQKTTDDLCNEITNRALDTKSKGLRSSKAKQSCIILDDYDFVSENQIPGKSPIDSLCGLVESIDVRNQELTVSSNTCNTDRQNYSPDETFPSNALSKFTVQITNHSESIAISSGKKEVNKCSGQKNGAAHNEASKTTPTVKQKKKTIDAFFGDTINESQCINNRGKKRKREDININITSSKTEEDLLEKSKIKKGKTNLETKNVKEEETPTLKINNPASVEIHKKHKKLKKKILLPKKRKNKTESPLVKEDSLKTSPSVKTMKPKRKSIAELPVDKKTASENARNKTKIIDNTTKQEKTKTKTSQYINKNNIIKPKRVDPIILALKNIRNYESLRRGSRISTLNMVTRRAMIGANEDPYGNLTNKRKSLKERISKNKSLLKRKITKQVPPKAIKNSNIKDDNSNKKHEESVKISENAEGSGNDTKTECGITEEKYTGNSVKKSLDIKSEDQKPTITEEKVKSIQIKTENVNKEQKADIKPVHNPNLLNIKFDCKTETELTLSTVPKIIDLINYQTIKTEPAAHDISPPSVDLTCHEKALSPEDIVPSASILSIIPPKKKNRRKPLHVFKSLPNPALEGNGNTKNGEDNDNIKNDSEDDDTRTKTNKVPVKKNHNTRFRGNKSVVPSHMSPRKRLLKPLSVKQSANEIEDRKPMSKQNIAFTRNSIVQNYAEHSSITINNKSPLHVKPSPIKRLQRPSMLNVSVKVIDEKPVGYVDDDDDDDGDDDESSIGSSLKDDCGDDESNKTVDCSNTNTNHTIKPVTSKPPKKRKKHVAVFEFQEKLKPLTRCSDEIRNGDVVWGKILGYGWWPGVVISNNVKSPTGIKSKERVVYVSWMSSNTSSDMNLKDLELFLPNFNKRFDNRKKSNYVRAVLEAQQACALKYGLL